MVQEKEIDAIGRKVKIKEILFIDMINIDSTNKMEATKMTLKFGSDLTDEEINKLTVKEGIEITKAINDLNGFVDFQKL